MAGESASDAPGHKNTIPPSLSGSAGRAQRVYRHSTACPTGRRRVEVSRRILTLWAVDANVKVKTKNADEKMSFLGLLSLQDPNGI